MCAMETRKARSVEYIVPNEDAGKTVLFVLRERMGASDGAVRRAKPVEGGITLDGIRVKTNALVEAGQRVSLVVDDSALARTRAALLAERGPLAVVFEDEDLLVVDKPAGQAVHPGPGHEAGTLGNVVAGYLEDAGFAGIAHPVQRIDAGTTGLVVFAKHAFAQDRLQRAFHTEAFEREYLAICEGVPEKPAGAIDAPIGRIRRGPSVFCVSEDGKRTVTRYRVLLSWDDANAGAVSLVRLKLETGRTHQVRLHMRHIGCPLLGDAAYGRASGAIARPALHSWRMAFDHPVTGERTRLAARVPDDMRAVLRSRLLAAPSDPAPAFRAVMRGR